MLNILALQELEEDVVTDAPISTISYVVCH
ncbi:class III lanthipeptide [Streptomyces sp. NPDC021212]